MTTGCPSLYSRDRIINFLFKNKMETYCFVLGFLIGMLSAFIEFGISNFSVGAGTIVGMWIGCIAYLYGSLL